jgi:hypothetical protein
MSDSTKHKVGKVRWLSAAVIAVVCLVASPRGVAVASAEPLVQVRIAPPAARVEVVPARPSPHHVWTHGYWNWNGHAHAWVPGRYVVERRGYVYREPRWEGAQHGYYRFHQGGYYRH